jgi:ATP-dependent DNA helicase RecG
MVTEMKSPRGERALQEAIAQGFVTENGHKNGHKNGHEDDQKPSKMRVPKFPAPIVEEVYKAIKLNRKAKYSWLQDNLGVSEATIKRAISDLKELGFINKEHSKIKGEWQLLK